jgi:hypothetical protein
METLARWIPTTPEMEVKVLFGRHVWDFAQHADALGKRAFELRASMQYSASPCAAYQTWLKELGELESTADRVAVFYDGCCTSMARRFRTYIEETDTLMDEPTVRMLERFLADFERMTRERHRLAKEIENAPRTSLDLWLSRELSITDIRAIAQSSADASPASS